MREVPFRTQGKLGSRLTDCFVVILRLHPVDRTGRRVASFDSDAEETRFIDSAMHAGSIPTVPEPAVF